MIKNTLIIALLIALIYLYYQQSKRNSKFITLSDVEVKEFLESKEKDKKIAELEKQLAEARKK